MTFGPWPRRAQRAAAGGLAASLALGLLGQAVRDRSAAWALLMYLPLVPLGLAALGLDLACRGRALAGGRARFGLGAIGLVGAALGVGMMVGTGPEGVPPRPGAASGREVSILQWNVVWGGGRAGHPARWAAIRRRIVAEGADLVVLNEAPEDGPLDQLVADLGPGAGRVQLANEAGSPDWYKLVVCSRWPLRSLGPVPIPRGAAMAVEADVAGRTVRILAVDGPSHPLIWRTPTLDAIAVAARRARVAGRPYDAIAGDFNGMARSLGFDAIAEAGYDLADRSSHGWRATFPSYLPLYDIDHVAVDRRLPILRCDLFTDLASDHRGQVARIILPE